MGSAKKELTQIELDLNNALKPFQIDTNQENINSTNHKLSAYHFVPATSSSESKKDENHSMLAQIFGDGTPLQQKQHQSKYKKYKKKKRKKNDDDNELKNDDDNNFILDDHEDRYKALDRK